MNPRTDSSASKNWLQELLESSRIYLRYDKGEATTICAGLLFFTYFLSMIIIPAFKHDFDWIKIQSIWDRWQSLNAAMIALAASIVALKITTHNYKKDRENNFRAAKAILPHALSDIAEYHKKCAGIHNVLYIKAACKESPNEFIRSFEIPAIPTEAITAFTECIRYSEINIGTYLSKILEELQVINARIKTIKSDEIRLENTTHSSAFFIKYIAESRAKIDSLFKYARNIKDFSEYHPTFDDAVETAESLLDVRYINFSNP